MEPAAFFQSLLSGASAGGIYALVAIGFGVMYRTTRVFNFAQGDFGALGAYVAFTLAVTWHLPFWAVVPLACIVVGVLAVVVERIALRPLYRHGEAYTFIATIGLAFAIQSAIQQIWGPRPRVLPSVFGDTAVQVFGLRVVPQLAAMLVISLALAGALYLFFTRTKIGTAMRAAAHNRRVAGLLGIPVDRIFSLAFFLGGAVGALAGILIAPIGLLTPSMGASLGVPGFIAALLGGLGSMPGAVIGGLLIGIVQSFAVFVVDPRYRDLVVYAAFILVMLVRPSGFFSEEFRARRI
ncbi:MAG: branched-chain amino acid transport system permease protein [Chloroflexota bacterium]|jgi:branched-chain amino acid transport system permease protein|nr:branched-chain amino acid transport system permease protein [Chloroflexota bacterium]